MNYLSKLLMAFVLAFSLIAAACGSDAAVTSAEAPATTTAPESSETTETAEVEATNEAVDEVEAADATVSITHFSGTDEVPVNPQTLVVMDLGMLVTLDSLGIEADGFGSLGTPVPAEYEALVAAPEPVGTAFEPDFEAISALEPDLIIVATRSSRFYAEMSEIAPTVDLTQPGEGDFFDEFSDVHGLIGEIFDVGAEVEAALAEIQAGIDEVAAQAGDAGTALVVMTTGAEVSAFGPGSWRFGLVHDLYGLAAADESLEQNETHGDVISFEFISNAAPDVLFVVDRSAAVGDEGESAEAVLDNDLVASTPAWASDRVVYADSFAWYLVNNSIPGFLQTTADVAEAVG